jgi:hypothetical protein
MNEIVSKIKKNVIGDKTAWQHTLGHSWRILLILAFFFVLYRAFAPNKTNVTVGKGGTANIYQAAKRFLIPFIEVYTEQRSGNDNLGYGVRGGLRFEF